MRINSRRSITSLAVLASVAALTQGAGLADLYSQTQQGSVSTTSLHRQTLPGHSDDLHIIIGLKPHTQNMAM